MNHTINEDLTRERVNWIIENIDEMFDYYDENENDLS